MVRRQASSTDAALLHRHDAQANTILGEQRANIGDHLAQLVQLRDLAGEAAAGLREGDVDALGVAVNKSWAVKRKLASGVIEHPDRRGGRRWRSGPVPPGPS